MTSVQQRTALDGSRVVEAVVHLTGSQAGAAADAVRGVVSTRYRVPTLSVDEVLAMREMTALSDCLDDLRAIDAINIVVLSVARLGLLVDALADAPPSAATPLIGDLEDLHADALRAALDALDEPAGCA